MEEVEEVEVEEVEMKEVEMKEVEEEAAAGESPAARPSRNAGGTSFPRTTRRPRENLRRHVPASDEDRRCPRREALTLLIDPTCIKCLTYSE